ncbi:MAG TPA: hypothetical protein VKT28_06970 [Puia sp.]|nr:hypothetical protein [Puia sp.]
MTPEELKETYSKYTTQELLEIIDKKFQYTELAVTIAIEEIAKRKISEDEIKKYKSEKIQEIGRLIEGNIVNDLTLLQKNFFFFIWLPLITFPFRQNFKDDKNFLKLKQANYYSMLGFVSYIVTFILLDIFNLTTLSGIGVLILCFLPAYSFDEFYNRRRQIIRLQKMFNIQTDETKDLNDEN